MSVDTTVAVEPAIEQQINAAQVWIIDPDQSSVSTLAHPLLIEGMRNVRTFTRYYALEEAARQLRISDQLPDLLIINSYYGQQQPIDIILQIRELAQKRNSPLPVILTSYTDSNIEYDPIVRILLEDGTIQQLIEKPFGSVQLVRSFVTMIKEFLRARFSTN